MEHHGIKMVGDFKTDNIQSKTGNASQTINNDGSVDFQNSISLPSGSAIADISNDSGASGSNQAMTANAIQTLFSSVLYNYISGLNMSNGTDGNNDIDIAVGRANSSDNSLLIDFNTQLTKQIDANWTAGTDAGGFPTGLTLSTDTWYHVFIISSADGSSVDAGFDTSLTATNLLSDATGYTKYRRIGSVLTESSNPHIFPFIQSGNNFWWVTPKLDVDALGTQSTTPITYTISVPPIEVICNITAAASTGSIFSLSIIGSSHSTYPISTLANTGILRVGSYGTITSANTSNVNDLLIRTADGQLIVDADRTIGGRLKIITHSWEDLRGQS